MRDTQFEDVIRAYEWLVLCGMAARGKMKEAERAENEFVTRFVAFSQANPALTHVLENKCAKVRQSLESLEP